MLQENKGGTNPNNQQQKIAEENDLFTTCMTVKTSLMLKLEQLKFTRRQEKNAIGKNKEGLEQKG